MCIRDRLAKYENIEFTSTKIDGAISDVSENLQSFIPLEGVDMSAMIMRLRSQKTKLEKEILKLEGMLKNEKFVANAPAEVIEANKSGLANAQEQLKKIDSELMKFDK